MHKFLGHIFWFYLICASVAADAVKAKSPIDVLVSIPPLALIAEDIYGQEVGVLLRGAASPHHGVLRPSDLRNIAKADLIFWVGPDLEPFLAKAVRNKPQIALKDLLVENPASDSHIWLDLELAARIAEVMAQKLLENYPEREAELSQRLSVFKAALIELDQTLQREFKTVAPFIIFHDSLTFWVQRYQLPQLAALTDVPDESVGLKTLANVASANKSASCLLSESGESQVAAKYAQRLQLPLVEVDILATLHSHNSYVDFILSLAKSVTLCVDGNAAL